MTPFDADFIRTVAIGIGATALMDLWLTLLKALGLPTLNFALLGRWVGHMPLEITLVRLDVQAQLPPEACASVRLFLRK